MKNTKMKTPREILSQLQRLSTTCETPEDGILQALKIIGDYGTESWRQGMTDAANIAESYNNQSHHGNDTMTKQNIASEIRAATMPNDEVSHRGLKAHK